jgi:hypothetical protein
LGRGACYDKSMETPKSPTELLALQTKLPEETFEEAFGTLLNDFDPEADEVLALVTRLLRSLKGIAYSNVQSTEDYLKQQWQEDYGKLSKALDLLKAVDL